MKPFVEFEIHTIRSLGFEIYTGRYLVVRSQLPLALPLVGQIGEIVGSGPEVVQAGVAGVVDLLAGAGAAGEHGQRVSDKPGGSLYSPRSAEAVGFPRDAQSQPTRRWRHHLAKLSQLKVRGGQFGAKSFRKNQRR